MNQYLLIWFLLTIIFSIILKSTEVFLELFDNSIFKLLLTNLFVLKVKIFEIKFKFLIPLINWFDLYKYKASEAMLKIVSFFWLFWNLTEDKLEYGNSYIWIGRTSSWLVVFSPLLFRRCTLHFCVCFHLLCFAA